MLEAPSAASASPDAPPPPVVRVCLVRLAGALLAVDVRSVREVAVFDELTVVPRGPAHLRGVANLRGTIMPLMDVGPMLGLGAARPARGITAAVVQDGPIRVGVIVDAAEALEPFAEILPASSGSGAGVERRFVQGMLPWREDRVPLLDIRQILDALAVETRRIDPLAVPARAGAG